MPLTKATQNVITPNICTTDTIQTITGTKTFQNNIEVGGVTNAFIDFKSPDSEDYDMRVGTFGGSNGYVTTKANQNLKIYAENADVHIQSDLGNKVGIGTVTPTEKLDVVGNIKASGNIQGVEGNFQTIEVGNTSPGAPFIDIKSPTTDDYDLRLTTDGTNGIIRSFGNIYLQPAPFKAIIILEIGTYANNADAVAGGLLVNSVYKTVTGELRIVV
jgi:hypothetical protein